MIELRPVALIFRSHVSRDDDGTVYGYVLEETPHLTLELHTPLGEAGDVSVGLTADERDILDQLLFNITQRAKNTLNQP